MTDLMADVGGTEFMKMVKSVGMEDKLESKNMTVFVPNDEAVKQYETEIFATVSCTNFFVYLTSI